MKASIDRADKAKVGDIIVVPARLGDRDIHFTGRVLAITHPHEDITEFKVRLLAHVDDKEGEYVSGVRHECLIAIFRS